MTFITQPRDLKNDVDYVSLSVTKLVLNKLFSKLNFCSILLKDNEQATMIMVQSAKDFNQEITLSAHD